MTQVDTGIQVENAGWTFENIADDFDDHVQKSVPLYDQGHELVCKLSDFFLPPNATVTEIGTATGVLAEKFLKHNARRDDIRYIGIDPVQTMIERAQARTDGDPRALFVADNALTCDLEKSNMIISYYTMQFIHGSSRRTLSRKRWTQRTASVHSTSWAIRKMLPSCLLSSTPLRRWALYPWSIPIRRKPICSPLRPPTNGAPK